MGYDVEITRDPLSSGRGWGRRIHLEEWYDVVCKDDELRFVIPHEPERHPPFTVRWIAHPETESENATQWLHYQAGCISVKYPDAHMLKKMVLLSRKLKAIVVGDNLERYQFGENGEVIFEDSALSSPANPNLYGLGAVPCHDLTAMIAKDGKKGAVLHYTWYLGFLTSFNQARHGRGDAGVNYPLTQDRISEGNAFLQSYSMENPEKYFIQAVLALIRMHDLRLN